MSKKKSEPTISVKLTAVIQVLAAVVVVTQVPNVTTPVALGAITLAGLVIGAAGRPKRNAGRS
ncbi:hypothetical protein [Rhodococcus sp. BS-15]|uniref:hypothetical protein n=1 Tax=Rhodococcus sp. BS-15 TaxID=1304954 RepID=UPI000FFB0E8B|nr:hypothetical protein [Rhodococcus sp. BS-15]